MQFFDNLKRTFQDLKFPGKARRSCGPQLSEDVPDPDRFSFKPATGPDMVVESFRQFGGIVVESKADAPSGWCTGRISVGGERDSRMFAFDSPDSFRQATVALTFSCGMVVFGRLED